MKHDVPGFACIIGARKGSRRLPGKNRLPLAGSPLYRHTLDAALASERFERIVFTTDDELILEALEAEKGVIADRRPTEMANDAATMMDVIFDLITRRASLFQACKYLCILTPCNPFREAKQLRDACEMVTEHHAHSLVSITEFPFPPELGLELNQRRVSRSWSGPARPGNYPKRYYPNGAVTIVDRHYFLQNRTFYAQDALGLLLGMPECVDIDLPEDYELARLIMENRYRSETSRSTDK